MQTNKVKRLGSGYSSIYKTSEWQKEQHDFEIRLGNYARGHEKSHDAVNKGLRQMKNVLWTYYHNQFFSLGKQNFFLQAFTKNDPSMTEQVKKEVGKELVKFIDTALYGSSNDALHGDLCKKMSAFYNASGISSDASNQSINFKNIMQKIVTSNSRKSENLIKHLHLNKEAVGESIKHNSKNIFKAGLFSGLHNLFKGPDVYGKYGMEFKSYDKYDRGLKVKYNTDEKKEPAQDISEKTNDTDSADIKESISPNGFRLTENGSSSTTTKLLNTAKWLGLKGQDLLNFRLAIMGWLLPDGDHSLYEILYSSHAAGMRGKEDLTDAASMDETIDPLTKDEIRDNCGTKETLKSDDSYSCNPIDKLNYYKFSLLAPKNSIRSNFAVQTKTQNIQALTTKMYTGSFHQLLNNKLDFNYYLGQSLGNSIFKKVVYYETHKELCKLILDTQTALNNDPTYLKVVSSLKPNYEHTTKRSKKLCKQILDIQAALNNDPTYLKAVSSLKPNHKYTPMRSIVSILSDTIFLSNIIEKYKSMILGIKDSTNVLNEYLLKYKIKHFINSEIALYLTPILTPLLDDIDVINSNQSEFLANSPKHKGIVYSGQLVTKNYDSFYKTGNIITLSSKLSASTKQKTANLFITQKYNESHIFRNAALFEIELIGKNGVNISKFSYMPDQKEVILLPGTRLRVESVGTTIIERKQSGAKMNVPHIKFKEVDGDTN